MRDYCEQDGLVDIVWRNPLTGENGMWLMNGFAVQSAQPVPAAGPPWVVAVADDFDGDGKADIVWRNPLTGENGMWLMDGTSIKAAAAIPGAALGWDIVR